MSTQVGASSCLGTVSPMQATERSDLGLFYPDTPRALTQAEVAKWISLREVYEKSSHTWRDDDKVVWFSLLRHVKLTKSCIDKGISRHVAYRQIMNGTGTWAHVVMLKLLFQEGDRFLKCEPLQKALVNRYPRATFDVDEWSEEYLECPFDLPMDDEEFEAHSSSEDDDDYGEVESDVESDMEDEDNYSQEDEEFNITEDRGRLEERLNIASYAPGIHVGQRSALTETLSEAQPGHPANMANQRTAMRVLQTMNVAENGRDDRVNSPQQAHQRAPYTSNANARQASNAARRAKKINRRVESTTNTGTNLPTPPATPNRPASAEVHHDQGRRQDLSHNDTNTIVRAAEACERAAAAHREEARKEAEAADMWRLVTRGMIF